MRTLTWPSSQLTLMKLTMGPSHPPSSGDDKDHDDEKKPYTHRRGDRRQRPRRYQSRGRHAHVADGDQSTSKSNSDSEGEEHNFLSLALNEDTPQPMRFAALTRGKSVSFSLPHDPFGQISIDDECTIEDGEEVFRQHCRQNGS